LLVLDQQPAQLPSDTSALLCRHRAIQAASRYALVHRLTEGARKAAFHLSPSQKALIPVVQRLQNCTAEVAQAEVFAAFYTGLDLSVACATTQLESNGQHIYGNDPGTGWMQGLDGKLVTKDNYLTFVKPGLYRGETLNGVGIKQLTSLGLVQAADARGGAWHVEHNAATGDRFFLELLRQTGSLWQSFYSYNGSGSAAQNYANHAVAVVAQWRANGL
jgi:hypothetical protein